MTLPAFAAERRTAAPAPAAVDRYVLPAGAQQQTRRMPLSIDGGQTRAVLTNGHTKHVPRAPDFFFLRGPNWLWWNNFF